MNPGVELNFQTLSQYPSINWMIIVVKILACLYSCRVSCPSHVYFNLFSTKIMISSIMRKNKQKRLISMDRSNIDLLRVTDCILSTCKTSCLLSLFQSSWNLTSRQLLMSAQFNPRCSIDWSNKLLIDSFLIGQTLILEIFTTYFFL